ncbi:hypothetical protein VNO78_22752 [Psophocarpus tetragonolobus]|uniref:Uncharacterized protein n=1 Tax=Psophocarpus tetragonolobus TaxID=3891 RepID=A0AAN9S2D6_PSOTE
MKRRREGDTWNGEWVNEWGRATCCRVSGPTRKCGTQCNSSVIIAQKQSGPTLTYVRVSYTSFSAHSTAYLIITIHNSSASRAHVSDNASAKLASSIGHAQLASYPTTPFTIEAPRKQHNVSFTGES